MNKERIKSFILILLILNSIQLTLQLLFDKNIWPEGSAEFVKDIPVIGSIISFFSDEADEYMGEEFYKKTMKPRRIVVNGGGAREIYLKETEYYNEGMGYIEALLFETTTENSSSKEISYDDWKNYFKAKSVYVDYGYVLDADALNRAFGLNSSGELFKNISEFSGFVITPDSATRTFTICTLNETDNVVTEYKFQGNTEKLLDFIEETTYQKHQNDAFAFEINLDVMTSMEDEVERKVAFSPLSLLTIPTEFEKDVVLKSEKLFETEEELEDFAEKTLNIFGYSASSLRKTVNNDGTISFIENKATIRFFYDGTIEYNAVSKENGLRLSGNTAGAYQSVCDVLNVAGKIWSVSPGMSESFDYHLASKLADNKENIYEVKIDSMYNGTTIHYKNMTEHAVFATVQEGYITNLVVHISNIVETTQQNETVPVLMGIDTVYEKYGTSGMLINDVYRCYDFDDNGKGIVKWKFELESVSDSSSEDTVYLN